jgi:hypothetical protein
MGVTFELIFFLAALAFKKQELHYRKNGRKRKIKIGE